MKCLLSTLALTFAASTAVSADMITYDTDQSFEDVTFGLESAIVDAGLVIDSISYTGNMLERTKGDVGSDVTLYLNADIYSFCSAKVSREVMEDDPMNIAYCPYDIFVMVRPESPDVTTIGFRTFPDGAMKKVESLLDELSRAAIGLDD
ncbi:DUF302 domain-containing protein [Marivita sp. S0852]|uniref:DUF302 domain-containing protein n=1 Tax=Marivita sp. S0852 TaxID=3373893 RepID=UPI003981CE7F